MLNSDWLQLDKLLALFVIFSPLASVRKLSLELNPGGCRDAAWKATRRGGLLTVAWQLSCHGGANSYTGAARHDINAARCPGAVAWCYPCHGMIGSVL